MNIRDELIATALQARRASYFLSGLNTGEKNHALVTLAENLTAGADSILAENQKDIANAVENGIKESMTDRLMLNRERIEAMAASLRKVAALPDPTGLCDGWSRPNGLEIRRVRVPLGVVGMIYESRPNVTLDAAALCLKSGNACILKGGREALRTNIALTEIIRGTLRDCAFPDGCVNLIAGVQREYVNELLRLHGYLDVIIPRGGAGLIRAVSENSSVPVIETGAGNCHIYIDESADLNMGLDILINAKVQRPSVCNAAETLLVHRAAAERFLPPAAEGLTARGVALRAAGDALAILQNGGFPVAPATEEDFYTEYNDLILAVATVSSLTEAIEHINLHSTHHSECIVTKDLRAARLFSAQVDSAAVYTNASTRFTDGEEFGFGAEIGIATGKLHARGPMGLNELTTVKYLVAGNGNVR